MKNNNGSGASCSLFYTCKCSYIAEKCARAIFVRKNVKNYIFLDEWLGVRISIIQAYMVDCRCIEKGIGNF